jgi:hypothetical protein
VAIGYQALQIANAGINDFSFSGWGENTAVGGYALSEDSTGADNTAVGYATLESTTGNANTAVGSWALALATTASNNTAIGYQALSGGFLYTTTGSDNTADGVYALYYDQTGGDNTAIGYGALGDNVGGSGNVAVGYQAGIDLTNGDNNIYIGNPGVSRANGDIRIGTTNTASGNTLIAGIYGTSLPVAASPVLIDASGHLGTSAPGNSYTPTIGDGEYPFTTTTQSGYYTKTGNLVYFEIHLIWSNDGFAGPENNVEISLPVPVASQRAVFSLGSVSGIYFNSQLTAGANNGDSNLQLYNLFSSGDEATPVIVDDVQFTGEVQISGTYRWQ